MKFILLILLFLYGCESFIYSEYKIINNKPISLNIYKVKSGDNLYSISRKLNISISSLIKLNKITPPYKIFPKQKIILPKQSFHKIKNPKNLEKVTRIFFSQRRKMLKKPFNQLFNGDKKILSKLKIDLNLRPQNLDFDTYYKLTSEYEKLRS